MRFRFAAVALATPAFSILAQQRAMPAAEYARAERYMSYNTTPLVTGAAVRPTWISDDRFVYRRSTAAGGGDVMIVDPVHGTRTRLLDDPKMSAAVAAALGSGVDVVRLASTQNDLSTDGRMINVSIAGKTVSCDVETTRCGAAVDDRERLGGGGRGGRGGRGGGGGAGRGAGRAPESLSPDGKRAVFIRDWNLWMRDVATNRETQLTTDGVKDFGYATDNAGWASSDRAVLVWSPDSKKIATFQQDQRNVGELYLVATQIGHPELKVQKYPLPGDSVIPMIHRVIIDVSTDAPKMVRIQLPPDPHRSTLCDNIACRGGEWSDVEWYPDGSHLAFVSTSRDHKHEVLRVADAATGAVRQVLEEKVDAVRVRKRPSELARASGVERGDLVLRARRLGAALPLRPQYRTAQAPDHDRRGQRHAAPAHRSENSYAVLPRRGEGKRPRSVLPPFL